MKIENIKIAGIIDEEPFSPLTWSGSSYYFFSALKESNVLLNAIPAQLDKAKEYYYKVTNFHPILSTWRFKYRNSTRRYDAMTAKIRKDLDSLDKTMFSCVLQVGAWYDATNYGGKISVSYHDGNIAAFMKNPYYKKAPLSDKYSSKAFKYEKELYSRMHSIFPMSRWLADSFVRDFDVNPKKVYPVGAGINLPNSAIEEICSKDYSSPSILFIGKDFQRKGGEYLLRAFRRVRSEIPQATLTIIGPSITLQDDGVKILGPISKITNDGLHRIINAYRNSSIFVLPSLYEPFGIAFCEAMAFHLPCIGTKVCAMPEIIEHNKSGFIVPPGDERSLADAMINLLKNPSLCKEMGKAGFKRYKADFTWDAVVKKIVEVISSCY